MVSLPAPPAEGTPSYGPEFGSEEDGGEDVNPFQHLTRQRKVQSLMNITLLSFNTGKNDLLNVMADAKHRNGNIKQHITDNATFVGVFC